MLVNCVVNTLWFTAQRKPSGDKMIRKLTIIFLGLSFGIFAPLRGAEVSSVWQGNLSNSWFTPGNWTNNQVPDNSNPSLGLNQFAKAKINVVTPASACELSQFVEVQWVHNGGLGVTNPLPLKIMAGGYLKVVRTDDGWFIGGYNGPGVTEIYEGGTLDTTNTHCTIGFFSDGWLYVHGGLVKTSHFQIGPESGTGAVGLYGGSIEAENLTILNGSINITEGTLVVSGDRQSAITGYIEQDKLKAYDGLGTVLYDYNITHAGKTTIWAVAADPDRIPGDVNGDNDIDSDDLILFSQQWLHFPADPNCDFTLDRKVDMMDFNVLASRWLDNAYSETLTGKIMCGYQGWFNCPTDGANRGWVHWGDNSTTFQPGACNIDLWPDMSEYDADEKFATNFVHADGSTAYVFSSYHQKTVLKHFSWMQQYGIDGVFLQRFATETTPGSKARSHRDQVMLHCRQGGNLHKRSWAMMYDLSGLGLGGTQKVIDDWKYLVDTFGISKDPTDRSYLRHAGKPVVAIWGIGFTDRSYTLQECGALIDFFKTDPVYGGTTVMIGIPSYWRGGYGDCVSDPARMAVFAKADILSPWAVGRFGSIYPSELDTYANNVWIPDMAWCRQNNKEYLPVVFPGFSWYNLRNGASPLDQIPRQGGAFLWRQIYKATAGGASMIYQAMFDEVDEATAIFKCTNNPPVGASPFLTYEGLPTDHYMWLVGKGTQMLRGDIPLSQTMPTRN